MVVKEVYFFNKNLPGLNPLNIGHEKCEPGYACGPEIRGNYWFHYIISGHGTLVIDTNVYHPKPGQAFIIPRGRKTFFQADTNDPWEYIWFGFNGDRAKQLDELKSPVIDIDYSYFSDIFDCKYYPNMEAEFLAGKLYIIFAQLFKRQYPGNYITAVKEYISEHYSQTIRIGQIADIIGINRKYLAGLFKKETGQTMQDFLMQVRMNKATAIINNHHYSVTKTAEMVGYTDIYAFSKNFKKFFGCSPSAYVKKTKKEL